MAGSTAGRVARVVELHLGLWPHAFGVLCRAVVGELCYSTV